jgi:hypothetical protein
MHETHSQGVTNQSVPCGGGTDRAVEGRREDYAQGSGTPEGPVAETMAIGGTTFGILGGGAIVNRW